VYRPGEVLERALAEGDESKIEFSLNLLSQRSGDANAGRGRKLLQPSGDVDAVAEQVFAFDDYVAEVDANAELHPPPQRQIGIAALQHPLDGDRCANRLNGTHKFGHHAVARYTENPPAVLDNKV
jgi:hypothetical protein